MQLASGYIDDIYKCDVCSWGLIRSPSVAITNVLFVGAGKVSMEDYIWINLLQKKLICNWLSQLNNIFKFICASIYTYINDYFHHWNECFLCTFSKKRNITIYILVFYFLIVRWIQELFYVMIFVFYYILSLGSQLASFDKYKINIHFLHKIMHSIDYLLREVEEKLNMVNSMKMKYQKSNMASRQNLDSLKAAIDKSISYHIETLKIRGDWQVTFFLSLKEANTICIYIHYNSNFEK